jgi:hypothetical protein
VIRDKAGNLYGTTSYGLISNNGPTGIGGGVFELSESGGVWSEKLLYTYADYSLSGVVMDSQGNLFGVGTNSKGVPFLFKLSPNGKGGWTVTQIHSFSTTKTGTNPQGNLVLDVAGNVYGTTQTGGTATYGTLGVVYEAVKGQTGAYTYKVLYSFTSASVGEGPVGPVGVNPAGDIFGATQFGGNGDGNVFELVNNKGVYTGKSLVSFDGADGSDPLAGVILYTGNVYGTTSQGGSQSEGLAYEVVP